MTPGKRESERIDGEIELLERAQAGDEAAFEALVAPWRGRLTTLCYQMLGSLDEAEDALQDTLLRAWTGIGRFESRSTLGTWLHSIATRRCLTAIEQRRGRALPVDLGPPVAVGSPSGDRRDQDTWIDPFPELAGVGAAIGEPAARYELRESIELAFIVAIQHLSPNQRAVLLLRDVLGFSAKETAAALETSAGSVTSALQRARRRVEQRLPIESQQATLRAIGDERLTATVKRYREAWEQGNVDSVVALLSEDASFSMPPLERWYEGREAIATFLRDEPLAGVWRWRMLPAQANGQPALAFYNWEEGERCFVPFALNVLGFEGEWIASVTAFIVSAPAEDAQTQAAPAGKAGAPAGPANRVRRDGVFERFGLPPRL